LFLSIIMTSRLNKKRGVIMVLDYPVALPVAVVAIVVSLFAADAV
jgi:hypothetical protein